MIDYNVISTGSEGNAVILNKAIMIDAGVAFNKIKPYYKDLKIVFLTHIHSDHFCRSTVRKLARERPSLRWACREWMLDGLIYCGVAADRIDILEDRKTYGYGLFNLIPVETKHNVPNTAYKIHFGSGEKLFYATDCNNLDGITAKAYDLYMVEANYSEDEIKERIKQKRADGQYIYEYDVMNNHLSKEKCDDWLYKNMGPKSAYVYMHIHSGLKTEAV